MKKLYFLFFVFLASEVFAQAPLGISYQAIIRDGNGDLVVLNNITIQTTLLKGGANGTAVYREAQTLLTNDNGLVSIVIGQGTIYLGNLATIDWADGPYFVKTEIDPTGGANFTLVDTKELLSVPFALHANTADSISGTYNELDPLFNASIASGITSADTAYWNSKASASYWYMAGNVLTYDDLTRIANFDPNGQSNPVELFQVTAGGIGNSSRTAGIFVANGRGENTAIRANAFSQPNNGGVMTAIVATAKGGPTASDTLHRGGVFRAEGNGRNEALVGTAISTPSNTADQIGISSTVGGSGPNFSNAGSGRHYAVNAVSRGDGGHNYGVRGVASNTGQNGNGTSYGGHFQAFTQEGYCEGVRASAFNSVHSGNSIYGLSGLVSGFSNGGAAVFGGTPLLSSNIGSAVRGYGLNTGTFNIGVFGIAQSNGIGDSTIAIGISSNVAGNDTCYGLVVDAVDTNANINYGVYSEASNGRLESYAGYFIGDLVVNGNITTTGSISKGSGTFKIDHPQDPENKFLVHSFVESPEMINIYSGNCVTDASGFARVELPDYFTAVNADFRYQLTVIGSFARAIIKEEISGNSFLVQTDEPEIKVSWQVTGVRNDPYAVAHRITDEEEKPAHQKGKYLHPELYDSEAAIYPAHAKLQGLKEGIAEEGEMLRKRAEEVKATYAEMTE